MSETSILLERIYENTHQSGYRVLVDRIWPRGVTKTRADLDDWCKSLAPSTELRKWFNHRAENWETFQQSYLTELQKNKDEAVSLLGKAHNQSLILIYGAKDKKHSHALILRKYLLNINQEIKNQSREALQKIMY